MTTLIFGLPGGAEWIILVIALLLIFGGSRIADLGKGTGRAVREFKEEIHQLPADKATTTEEARVADPLVTGTSRATEPVDGELVETKAPAAGPADLR